MFKFQATDNWYKMAAIEEADYEISAGPEIFPFTTQKSDDGNSGGGSAIDNQQIASLQVGFRIFMRKLRMSAGLTLPILAEKADIELEQLLLIEQQVGYKPYPRTLNQLAKFYDLPLSVLMQMVGSTKKIDRNIEENVVRFAAESESFEKLTNEEKKTLNQLVKVLRDYSKK
jgi:transcriptional regulator with XRE-family HTH domain